MAESLLQCGTEHRGGGEPERHEGVSSVSRATFAPRSLLRCEQHVTSAPGLYTGCYASCRTGQESQGVSCPYDLRLTSCVLASGSCCVKQCIVPNPHTRSTAWIPTTARSVNSSANTPRAERSFGSLNVGTSTAALPT